LLRESFHHIVTHSASSPAMTKTADAVLGSACSVLDGQAILTFMDFFEASTDQVSSSSLRRGRQHATDNRRNWSTNARQQEITIKSAEAIVTFTTFVVYICPGD